jgi:hypothetical protein
MCLIVLCCLSLCYMCIHLFDCYSMYIFLYMFFANKEFIHSFNKIQSMKYPTVRTVPQSNTPPSEQFHNPIPHRQNSSTIKYPTVRTVPQSNRKIVQAESKLITLTHKSPIALLPCYVHFNKTLKTESSLINPPGTFY